MANRTLIALLTLPVLLPLTLQAAIAAPHWDQRWQCGKEIGIKKSTIQYLKRHKLLYAFRLKGKALPLLLSEDYGGSGLILYTKLNKRWRAYPIANHSIAMGVYSTDAHFRVSIFAMSQHHQLMALNIKNQFRDIRCNKLPIPYEVRKRKAQYLSVQSFNILPSGRGQLLGAAYDFNKAHKSKLRWYRYHTHNWGYQWSKPGPIKAPKKGYKLAGAFSQAKRFTAPNWLTRSLLKQAR